MNKSAFWFTSSLSGTRHRASVFVWAFVTLLLLAPSVGCKTMEPFNQSMRTRVAAAREWTGNGLDAIKRGSLREARDCFTKASSQLPNDHRIVANVARTHFQEGQTRLAIEAMQKAVELAPHDADLHAELGELYLADRQWQRAVDSANLSLERNHRLASAWLLKGKTYAAKSDYRGALGHYQRALGIDGDREDIQMQIVMTYQELGEPIRALSAVEQLLEKHPSDRQPEAAILAKSTALRQLNQISPAIEMLETASRRSDVTSQVFLQLADAQESAGRSDSAFQTLVKAQMRFPARADIAAKVDQMRAQDQRYALLQ